jgi:hypothetical protein
MTDSIEYTAITFAPVQGFIEKSRKLRDLYGSSFIISHLAKRICDRARELRLEVVSPALINVTQGTPNQIIVKGNFPKEDAEKALNLAWKSLTKTCREWIEHNLPQFEYCWLREWNLWTNHAWEFFCGVGNSIDAARSQVNETKRKRNWVGVNWVGESSTLSGVDAIAIPQMSGFNPKDWNYHEKKEDIGKFYEALSSAVGRRFVESIQERLSNNNSTEKSALERRYGRGFIRFIIETWPRMNEASRQEKMDEYGEAIVDKNEELSIPELIKRLITLDDVATNPNIGIDLTEVPETYRDLNRLNKKKKTKQIEEGFRWTGWFQGDGDNAGDYLKAMAGSADKIHQFSESMLKWGEDCLKPSLNGTGKGRIIYAGGDDLLGVFYCTSPPGNFLKPLLDCLSGWLPRDDRALQSEFQRLKSEIIDRGFHQNLRFSEDLKSRLTSTIGERSNDPKLEDALSEAGMTDRELISSIESPILDSMECLEWFYNFNNPAKDNSLWRQHQHPIGVTIGFVWAAPGVPQREILQHCREAEKTGKKSGKNRLVMKILFNGGNYVEWNCPWWCLEQVITGYRDRGWSSENPNRPANNWGHFYNDVNILSSRRAFDGQSDIAKELFGIYFPEQKHLLTEHLWDSHKSSTVLTGIIGNKADNSDSQAVNDAINQWVINLALVGFHLCNGEDRMSKIE